MDKHILWGIVIILLLGIMPTVYGIGVSNENFSISCTPDEATLQIDGYKQHCDYSWYRDVNITEDVAFCFDTLLDSATVMYNGQDITSAFHYKHFNIEKGECYYLLQVTWEPNETKSIDITYRPKDVSRPKWDTYFGDINIPRIDFKLDPLFNSTLYEIGTTRSTSYWWTLNELIRYNPFDLSTDLYIPPIINGAHGLTLGSLTSGVTNQRGVKIVTNNDYMAVSQVLVRSNAGSGTHPGRVFIISDDTLTTYGETSYRTIPAGGYSLFTFTTAVILSPNTTYKVIFDNYGATYDHYSATGTFPYATPLFNYTAGMSSIIASTTTLYGIYNITAYNYTPYINTPSPITRQNMLTNSLPIYLSNTSTSTNITIYTASGTDSTSTNCYGLDITMTKNARLDNVGLNHGETNWCNLKIYRADSTFANAIDLIYLQERIACDASATIYPKMNVFLANGSNYIICVDGTSAASNQDGWATNTMPYTVGTFGTISGGARVDTGLANTPITSARIYNFISLGLTEVYTNGTTTLNNSKLPSNNISLPYNATIITIRPHYIGNLSMTLSSNGGANNTQINFYNTPQIVAHNFSSPTGANATGWYGERIYTHDDLVLYKVAINESSGPTNALLFDDNMTLLDRTYNRVGNEFIFDNLPRLSSNTYYRILFYADGASMVRNWAGVTHPFNYSLFDFTDAVTSTNATQASNLYFIISVTLYNSTGNSGPLTVTSTNPNTQLSYTTYLNTNSSILYDMQLDLPINLPFISLYDNFNDTTVDSALWTPVQTGSSSTGTYSSTVTESGGLQRMDGTANANAWTFTASSESIKLGQYMTYSWITFNVSTYFLDIQLDAGGGGPGDVVTNTLSIGGQTIKTDTINGVVGSYSWNNHQVGINILNATSVAVYFDGVYNLTLNGLTNYQIKASTVSSGSGGSHGIANGNIYWDDIMLYQSSPYTTNNITSSFNGTNFGSYSNAQLQNLSGVYLYNQYGQVAWTVPLNVLNTNFDTEVLMGPNSIFVDSAMAPQLNYPANITFTTTLANPKIYKDGVLCTTCTLLASTGNTYTYSVTGFSNYTLTASFNDSFDSGVTGWTNATVCAPASSTINYSGLSFKMNTTTCTEYRGLPHTPKTFNYTTGILNTAGDNITIGLWWLADNINAAGNGPYMSWGIIESTSNYSRKAYEISPFLNTSRSNMVTRFNNISQNLNETVLGLNASCPNIQATDNNKWFYYTTTISFNGTANIITVNAYNSSMSLLCTNTQIDNTRWLNGGVTYTPFLANYVGSGTMSYYFDEYSTTEYRTTVTPPANISQVIFQDDFNRADTVPDNVGGNWTVHSDANAAFYINSNQLRLNHTTATQGENYLITPINLTTYHDRLNMTATVTRYSGTTIWKPILFEYWYADNSTAGIGRTGISFYINGNTNLMYYSTVSCGGNAGYGNATITDGQTKTFTMVSFNNHTTYFYVDGVLDYTMTGYNSTCDFTNFKYFTILDGANGVTRYGVDNLIITADYNSTLPPTLLPYWRDPVANSTVWVKMNLTANKVYTITVANGTSTTSDGYNVFEWFDDFPGAALNTSKWNTTIQGTPGISVSNSIVTLDSNSDSLNVQAVGLTGYPLGYGILLVAADTGNTPPFYRKGVGWLNDTRTFDNGQATGVQDVLLAWNGIVYNANNTWASNITGAIGTFHTYQIERINSTLHQWHQDYNTIVNGTQTIFSGGMANNSMRPFLGMKTLNGTLQAHAVGVYKSNSNAPIISCVGNTCTITTSATTSLTDYQIALPVTTTQDALSITATSADPVTPTAAISYWRDSATHEKLLWIKTNLTANVPVYFSINNSGNSSTTGGNIFIGYADSCAGLITAPWQAQASSSCANNYISGGQGSYGIGGYVYNQAFNSGAVVRVRTLSNNDSGTQFAGAGFANALAQQNANMQLTCMIYGGNPTGTVPNCFQNGNGVYQPFSSVAVNHSGNTTVMELVAKSSTASQSVAYWNDTTSMIYSTQNNNTALNGASLYPIIGIINAGGTNTVHFDYVAIRKYSGANVTISCNANLCSVTSNETITDYQIPLTTTYTGAVSIYNTTASLNYSGLIIGLRHYYALDEVSGNALDSYDSAPLIQNSTVGTATGKINGARGPYATNSFFNNSNMGINFSNNTAWSISGWFNNYGNQSVASSNWVWSTGSGVNGQYNMQLMCYDGANNTCEPHAYLSATGVTACTHIIGANISRNVWHHAVITQNSTTAQYIFYLDGVLIGSQSTSCTNAAASNTHFWLGRENKYNLYFNGSIDEVALYNRTLSLTDVQALYNNGLGIAYPFTGVTIGNVSITSYWRDVNTNQSVWLKGNWSVGTFYITISNGVGTSNGPGTFTLFDDFSSLNSSLWVANYGTPNVTNGILYVKGTGGGHNWVNSTIAFGTNVSLGAYTYMRPSGVSFNEHYIAFGGKAGTESTPPYYIKYQKSPGAAYDYLRTNAGSGNVDVNTVFNGSNDTSFQFRELRRVSNTNIMAYMNNTFGANQSNSTNIPTTNNVIELGAGGNTGTDMQVHTVFVRPYYTIEPTITCNGTVCLVNVTNALNDYTMNIPVTTTQDALNFTISANVSGNPGFNNASYNNTFQYANNAITSNNNLTINFTSTDPNYAYTIYTLTQYGGNLQQVFDDYNSTTSYGGGSFTHTAGSRMGIGSTFTATQNYNLTGVGFDIQRNGAVTGSLIVTIYNASGTTPTQYIGDGSAILANDVSTSGGYYNFTFSTPIPIISGQKYFIGLKFNGTATVFPIAIYMNHWYNATMSDDVWYYDGAGNTAGDWTGQTTNTQNTFNLYGTPLRDIITTTTTTNKTYTWNNLADGRYYYGFTVYDTYGNSNFFDPNVTIDTTPPAISFATGTTANGSYIDGPKNVYVSVNVTEANPKITTINLYNTSGLYTTTSYVTPALLQDSLRLYYEFENSNTSAIDLSGNGLNGTFTGSPIVNTSYGKYGQGIGFNGSNQYITVNANLNATIGYTLSAWVYYNYSISNGGDERIIKMSDGALLGGISHVTNTYQGRVCAGGICAYCRSTAPNIPRNQWVHEVFVYNGSKPVNESATYYQNGVKYTGWANLGSDGQCNVTGVVANNTQIQYVGAADSIYLNGSLDGVRIYNRTLSDDEVQLLYLNNPLMTNTSYNFTNLPNGVYYYNATATDAVNLTNSTATWQATIIGNFSIANYTVTAKYAPGTIINDTTYYIIGNTTDTYFDHWDIIFNKAINNLVLNQNFDDELVGATPNGWGVSGSGTFNTTITNAISLSQNNSFGMYTSGGLNIFAATYNFPYTLVDVNYSLAVYITTCPDNPMRLDCSGLGGAYSSFTPNSTACLWRVRNSSNAQESIYNIPLNTWTNLTIEKHPAYSYYYVNGVMLKNATNWDSSNACRIDFVNFGSQGAVNMSIDNVYVIDLNTSFVQTNTSTQPNYRVDYSTLSDGIKYVNITATDKALNTYLWTNYWTIDTTPPVVSFSTGTTANASYIPASRTILINLTVIEANPNNTIVRLYNTTGLYASTSSLSNVSNGLLAYYAFDGNANDMLGNYNGVVSGVTQVAGKLGNAYISTGGTNSINISAIPFGENFSVCYWMNTTTYSSGTNYETLATDANKLELMHTAVSTPTGRLLLRVGFTDSTTTLTLTNLSRWDYVCWVKNGATFTSYVNGAVFENRGDANPLGPTNYTKVTLFNRPGVDSGYVGALDEVGIWNRPITATEVTQLYNNGLGMNPLATNNYYQFTGLPNGRYYYNATSTDLLGFSGSSPTWYADVVGNFTPGYYSVTTKYPTSTYTNDTTYYIIGNTTDTYFDHWDFALNALTNTSNLTNYRVDYSTLSDGIKYVNITATDKALNTYLWQSYYTVDTTYPVINFSTGTTANGTYQVSRNISINISLNETNPQSAIIRLYNTTGLYATYNTSLNTTIIPDSDSSNNGIATSVYGPVTYVLGVTGKIGQAIYWGNTSLDASGQGNQTVKTSSNIGISGNGARSFGGWMWKSNNTLYAFGGGSGTSSSGNGMYFSMSRGNNQCRIGKPFSDINIANCFNLTPDNAWFHYVVTFNGTSARLYFNGVDVGGGTGTWSTTDTVFWFGRDPVNANNIGVSWDGYIDEVFVYNRGLSSTEVSQIYNGGTGAYPSNTTGLLVYYSFDGLNPYAWTGQITNTFTNLTNGRYYYNATATDLAGQSRSTQTWQADIVGNFTPGYYAVSVKYPNATYTNDTTYYVIANSTDPYFKNWTFYLNAQVNGSTNANTRIDYTALSDGIKYNNITATDQALNTYLWQNQYTVDTTYPTINFTTGTTANGSYIAAIRTITINITASDTNFNRSIIRLYNSTGGLINSTTSNTTGTLIMTVTNLSNGRYYYNATATDLVGQSTNTQTWQADIVGNFTPGYYSVSVKYPVNTYTNDTTYYIIANSTDVYFKNWTFVLNAQVNGSTNANTRIDYTALSDGIKYNNITATDQALNTYLWQNQYTVDTTYPTITYATGTTPNNTFKSTNNIFINVTVSDTNLDPTQTIIRLYNSTGGLINYFGSLMYQETANSVSTAIDNIENASIYENYTKPLVGVPLINIVWRVKHGGPEYNITLPTGCQAQSPIQVRLLSQAGPSILGSTSRAYCYNGTAWQNVGNSPFSSGYFSGCGDVGYQTRAYDGDWSTETSHCYNGFWYYTNDNGASIYEDGIYWYYNATNIAYNFTNLTNGPYYYNATAKDLVGQSTTTPTYRADIIASFQNTSYTVTFPYVNNGYTNNNTLTYGFNTTDVYYNYTIYNITVIIPGVAQNSTQTSNTSQTFILADGKYYYDLRIFDKAGNSQYYDPNITIDTTNPYINYTNATEINGSTIDTRQTVVVAVNTSDTNYNYTILRLYNSTSLFAIYTNNVSGIISNTFNTNANGWYYFNATTYDLANNSNTTPTQQVYLDYYKNNITFTAYERTTNVTIPYDVYFIGQQDTYNYIVNDGAQTFSNTDLAFDGNTGTASTTSGASCVGSSCHISQLGKIFNQSTYVSTIYYNVRCVSQASSTNNRHCQIYLETYNNASWTPISTLYSASQSSNIDSGQVSSTYTLNSSTYGVRIRYTLGSTTSSGVKQSYLYELQPNTTYKNKLYYNFSVTNRTLIVDNIAKGNDTYNVIMNTSYGLGGYNTCTTNNWTAASNSLFSCVFNNNILNIIAYNSYTGAQITSFTTNLTLGDYSEVQTANITNTTYYLIRNQTYNMVFTHPSYFTQTITYTPQNATETLNQSINQSAITLRFFHAFDHALIANANITIVDNTINHTYIISNGILVFNPSAGSHNLTFSSPRYNTQQYPLNVSAASTVAYDINLYPILNVSIYEEKQSMITLTYFNFSHPQIIKWTVYCLDENGNQIGTQQQIIPNGTTGAYGLNATCVYQRVRFDLQYLNLDGSTTSYYRNMIFPATSSTFDFKVFLPDLALGYGIVPTALKPYDIFGVYTIDAHTQVQVTKLMPTGSELITSDYVDAEGKITAYLISGDTYIITILADDAPARILGPYSADTSGTKILRLFDVTLTSNEYAPGDTVLAKSTLNPIAGEEENHSLLVMHFRDPGNFTQTVTLSLYSGTCASPGPLIMAQTIPFSALATYPNGTNNITIGDQTHYDVYMSMNIFGSRYMNKSSNTQYCGIYNWTYFDYTTASAADTLVYDSYIKRPGKFKSEWTFPWIIMLLLVVIALGLNARTVSFGSLLITMLASILYGWNWFATGSAVPGVIIGVPIAVALLIAIGMNIKRQM